MIIRHVILYLCIGLGSVGCATVPMATVEEDSAAKKFSNTGSNGRIYLYRNEFFGNAVSMPVVLDGKVVGGTAAHTFFMWDVPPGQHQIQSLTENITAVTINVLPRQTYFVWQEVKMGWVQARSELHIVDTTEGQNSVLQCKLIKSGP